MRKYIAFMAVFIMAMVTPSFASVGVQVDNNKLGAAAKIRFNTSGLAQVNKALNFDGSTLQFNLMLAGTGTSGAVSLTADDGLNVERGYSVTYKAVGTTAEESFLHRGLPGEFTTIVATTVGSGGRWTLTDDTSTTWEEIVFDATDESISLLYISDSVGWVQVGDTDTTVVYGSF